MFVRSLKRSIALAVVVLGSAACSVANKPAPPPSPADSSIAQLQLKSLLEDHWSKEVPQRLDIYLKYGGRVDRLPELTQSRARRDAVVARALIRRIDQTWFDALPQADYVSLLAMRWEQMMRAEAAGFWLVDFSSVTPYASPLRTVAALFARHPMEDTADTERYLYLIESYPMMVDSIRAGLAQREARGNRLPKDAIDAIVPWLRGYAQPIAQSPFMVAASRLTAIDTARRHVFHAELSDAIVMRLNPAIERLAGYLEGSYRAQAPEQIGLWQHVGGKEYYRYLVRKHTSLDVTPDEVHAIGVAEVARIEGEMARIRAQLGFRGTQADFHATLRTDPKFFAATPEEVSERLMKHYRRAAEKIPQLFSVVPTAPVNIRRLDPRLEGSMTYGYYQAPTVTDSSGYYFFNGSRLGDRSLVTAAALVFHETVPGHHFQMSLQASNQTLPAFRREGQHTAFTEGWGEYAAVIAGELGLYVDPYDAYGRLLQEAMLATRLVVDTGLNYFGWTRAKASAYMREHTLESDAQIASETLRYATDLPGQALAYKMGARELLALRSWARRELGDRFDQRAWHDEVMSLGSLPLPVLGTQLEWWIFEQKRGATGAAVKPAVRPELKPDATPR